MRILILCGLCAALLCGCSTQAAPTEQGGTPVMKLEVPPVYETVASLPLSDTEPYEPWRSMEPDTASPDTVGDLLCETTLTDGTELLCYWEPESDYTKYWAIRQEDGTLRRFCQEYSAYPEGYSAEPFTDILGQDGFRISAPRGAAYHAYDYYTVDPSGTPRLLADCANSVIEADVNGDGERELLWFYHGGRDIFYVFTREGAVRSLCVTDALAEQAEPWLAAAESTELTEDSCLPIRALRGGSAEPVTFSDFVPARLRFTEEAVHLELEVPAS